MPSKRLTYKDKKQIVPFPDESKDCDAISRLNFIRSEYLNNIPDMYMNNWDRVKLYHPAGDPQKAFGLVLEEADGAFDVRNNLNELTGKSWVKFTSSWFIFNALSSDLKEEKALSSEFESHPATYSPTMIQDFIAFFTKRNQIVLDPFCGIGSTIEAAMRMGRIGIGVELNPKYVSLANLRIRDKQSKVIQGDSTKLEEMDLPQIDFSISSPPYWDVLNRSTKDFHEKRARQSLDLKYSSDKADLGNIESYSEFLDLTASVYEKVHALMKPSGYLVVIIKNVKKDGVFYPLAWDLANRLADKWVIKDEKIWIQDKVGLAPYGYPHSWVSNIIHHYCLIFQKR